MLEVKPLVAVSRCLLGERTRYDGELIVDEILLSDLRNFEVIGFCPELEIGLGVPRNPIVLVKRGKKIFAIDRENGVDFTERLLSVSRAFCEKNRKIHGFILKSKSPSCAISDARILVSSNGPYESQGMGVFAREAKRRFPFIPVIDENGFREKDHKFRFMLRVFILAHIDRIFDDSFASHKIRVLFEKFGEFFRAKSLSSISITKEGPVEKMEFLKESLAKFSSRLGVRNLERLLLLLIFPELFSHSAMKGGKDGNEHEEFYPRDNR